MKITKKSVRNLTQPQKAEMYFRDPGNQTQNKRNGSSGPSLMAQYKFHNNHQVALSEWEAGLPGR